MASNQLAFDLQAHSHNVFDAMSSNVVKVMTYDADGTPCGEASGFFYTTASPMQLIVTTAHTEHLGRSVISAGAVTYKVKYSNGMTCDATVQARPIKNEYDVMILSATKSRPSSASSDGGSSNSALIPINDIPINDIVGSNCRTADHIYLFGTRPGSVEVVMSTGTVASTNPGSYTITAMADNGFSGGPVFNTIGRLVGVVTGNVGTTIKCVTMEPAVSVHHLALANGLPGLRS